MTGLVLEVAVYPPTVPAWGYRVFLVHVAIPLELLHLAPFMTLAHTVYRAAVLFFVALAQARTREETGP